MSFLFNGTVLVHTLAAFGPMTSLQVVFRMGLRNTTQVSHAIKAAGREWVAAIGTEPRATGRPGRDRLVYALVKEDETVRITEQVFQRLKDNGAQTCAELADHFAISTHSMRPHLMALREAKRVRISGHRPQRGKWTALFDVGGLPDATEPAFDSFEELFAHDPSLEQKVVTGRGIEAAHVARARSRIQELHALSENSGVAAPGAMWAGLVR